MNKLRSKFNTRFNITKITRIQTLLILSIILIIFAIYRFFYFKQSFAQYDDSYITYRYAANFANGFGLVFNHDEKTNSASSLTWVLILSFIYYVFGSLLSKATVFIGLFLLIGCCLLVYKSTTLKDNSKLSKILGYSLVFAWVLNPFVEYWAVSGMETILFCSLYLISIYFYFKLMITKNHTKKRIIVLIIFFLSLLSLTRLEGIILANSLIIVSLLINEFFNFNSNSEKKWLRIRLTFIFVVLLLAQFSMFIFYKIYYGRWLPDPIRFKQIASYYNVGPLDNIFSLIRYSLSPTNFFLLLLIIIFCFFGHRSLNKFSIQTFVLPANLIAFILFLIFGAHSDYHRYELPITAILTVTLISIYQDSNFSKKTNFSYIFSKNKFIMTTFCLILVFGAISENYKLSKGTKYYIDLQFARIDAGKYINEHYPNSVYISGDLGAIAYNSLDNTFVDISGLTNSKLLDKIISGDSFTKEIVGRKPQYLVDTVSGDGIAGLETVFNFPDRYFNALPKSAITRPSCTFKETYLPTVLATFKDQISYSTDLSVQVWKLNYGKLPTRC